jgi:hypothetical protein
MKPCAASAALGLATLLGCASAVEPAPSLGSAGNPVRAHTFLGEIEYLARLRCPDGTRPHTQRLRPPRVQAHGHRLVGYRVRCIYLNAEAQVFLDPFHPDYAETEAIHGFVTAGDPDPRQLFWMKR